MYASMDYRFTELPITVSGEVRFARDSVDGSVLQSNPNLSTVPVTNFADDKDFSNTPWGLTVAWHLDNGQIYGKVASAYRHGGLNSGSGLPTDAFIPKLSYNEESSLTYEVGYKSSWYNNRLRLNVSGYFTTYEDYLNTTTNGCPDLCTLFDPVTEDPLGFDGNGNRIETNAAGDPGLESPRIFFIDNVGEAELWGLEVEVVGVIPVKFTGGRLVTNLGWSRQHGEVTSISSGVSPASQALLGLPLPRLRDAQIKANFIYRQPLNFGSGLFNGADLLAAVTYTHEHGGYRDLDNRDPLDGVDRMDARIGIDTNRWSLTVNGSNILDADYELFTYSPPGDDLFRQNDPSHYWVELGVRL